MLKKITQGKCFREKRYFGIFIGLALCLLSGCMMLQADREFAEGKRLFKSHHYAEAQRHALKAFEESPGTQKYKSLLGWTYLKQGRFNQARRLFTELYSQDQNSLPAFLGLAWVEYAGGHWVQAKDWFQQELNCAKYHAEDVVNFPYYSVFDQDFVISCLSDAQYGLGLLDLVKKDYAGAQTHLRKALKHPNNFIGQGPIKAALAETYYFQENYGEALQLYRELPKQSVNGEIALKLAWCLYYTGDYRQGERTLIKQLDRANDRRPVLYGLVFAACARGKKGESKTWLEELIKTDPYYADTPQISRLITQTWNWKTLPKEFARNYFRRGDFQRAQIKLHACLRQTPEDEEALVMEAWCDLYLHRLPLALSKFEILIQKDQLNLQAVLGRGVANLYLGKLAAAEADFQEVQARDPNNVRARVAQGAVAYLQGDLPRAMQIYSGNLNRLPEKEPFFSWASHALNNLGWCYLRTGQYHKALEVFQRLKDYHPCPIYPEAFNGLGWANLYLGKNREAQQDFKQALKLSPAYISAKAGLAKLAPAQD
jgi:tetratricopeptide (TPR) repeat protein